MNKIQYPGMPQEPVVPVKLEGIPEKKDFTHDDLSNARDSYVQHAYFLTEKRCEHLIEFAKQRDSVIDSPVKHTTLRELHEKVQFLDAALRRTMDLWRATDVLLDIEEGTITLNDHLITMKKNIPKARKGVVELIGKDLNETSSEEMIVISLFSDFRVMLQAMKK